MEPLAFLEELLDVFKRISELNERDGYRLRHIPKEDDNSSSPGHTYRLEFEREQSPTGDGSVKLDVIDAKLVVDDRARVLRLTQRCSLEFYPLGRPWK